MRLAIFDIDGTLTRTNRVDGECFLRALAEEFGAVEVNTSLMAYTHVTDAGITDQVFAERLRRAPTRAEVRRLQDRFVELLAGALAQSPAACTEVPGAAAALARLRECGWAVAIATGSWQASARLKLQTAGLAVADVPAAFADDAPARPDIVTTALARSRAVYGRASFERVVAIGDALLDVRTAQQLNLPFVGVRHDGDEGRLRKHGVTHVLTDFVDFDCVLQALEEADVPPQHTAPGFTPRSRP